jgi:hypothetical protein
MSLNLEQLDQEVSKEKLKLKATISGISHSGKTGTALMLAEKLADGDWTKILAVDVGERNGISVYDYLGKFRTIKLPPPYTLNLITECIQYAVSKGYKVIIFDSLTQFWSGVGGALEQADKIGKNPWNKISPVLRKTMLDALDSDIHVLFTLRQKSDKVEEVNQDTGKKVMKKIGMKDDFKPDSDYDFDLCIELDREHKAVIHKDRTRICPDNESFEFTSEIAAQIAEWTQKGKDVIGEFITEAEKLGIIEGNQVSKEAFIFANEHKGRTAKYLKLWYSEKDPSTGERKWVKITK